MGDVATVSKVFTILKAILRIDTLNTFCEIGIIGECRRTLCMDDKSASVRVRHQAIVWTNVDQVLRRHMMVLDLGVLT